MGYSRTLNSLKTVIAVATAFNIAACLVTETKQAAFAQEVIVTAPARPAIGFTRFSGTSPVSSSFTFDLVDVQDRDPNDSVGDFPEAIQNFNFKPVSSRPEINNSGVCGEKDCPATLKVTKLLPESRSNLAKFSQPFASVLASVIDVSKDVDILRYDVNFASRNSELFWFIQSNDSSLINDLSDIINVDKTKIVGQYNFSPVSTFYFTFDDISRQFTPQQVPEPSNTPALLGLAILGSVSLLKRNKRFLKSVTQNSSSLLQKST